MNVLGPRVRLRRGDAWLLRRTGRNLGALAELRWSLCCVAFRERRWRSGVLTEWTAGESGHLPVRPVRGPRGFLAYSLRQFLARELSLGRLGGRTLGLSQLPRKAVWMIEGAKVPLGGEAVVGRVMEAEVPPSMEQSSFSILGVLQEIWNVPSGL